MFLSFTNVIGVLFGKWFQIKSRVSLIFPNIWSPFKRSFVITFWRDKRVSVQWSWTILKILEFNVRIMFNRTRKKVYWYRKAFTSLRNWRRGCLDFRSYVNKWTYLNGVINIIITPYQSILCQRVLVLEYIEIKNSWKNPNVEGFLNLWLMYFR